MNEIWINIKKFPEYQVSNFGRVKSFKQNKNGKIMKPRLDHNGYPTINIRTDNKNKNVSIHRLVAENFIPLVEGKEYVNHIDGNKENNKVTNLEWVTQSENMIHAYKTKLAVPYARKKVAKIDITTNEIIEIYENIKDAMIKNNYGNNSRQCHISDCCLGKRKTCKGFKWIYLDS